jgi:hypothetical protein
METVQSFDVEFDEEPEKVLLNFKHLLFAFRWQGQTSLNYFEWLFSVSNDCFFFFLKKNEPMYAYHTLLLTEFYIKQVLHKSEIIAEHVDVQNSVY